MSDRLLARIEAQLHRAMARGARRLEADAFAVYIWPEGDLFYRNRALPLRRAANWNRAIGAMVATFGAHGRTPLVEHLAERWPGLGRALDDAGFVREMGSPVLVAGCAPCGKAAPARLAAADEPLLAMALGGARVAFALAPTGADADELAGLRRDLAAGFSLYAVVEVDGSVQAGAGLVGGGDVAELVAVWAAAEMRGRGLASAVCRCLLRRFFATGGELVWCSAAGEPAARLYRRLGFRPVATQLDHVLPPP